MFKWKLNNKIRSISIDKQQLVNDDFANVLKTYKDNTISACVTDPPQNINIMGKSWDHLHGPMNYQLFTESWGEKLIRVMKPGAHLVAFLHSKTQHRAICGLEDAGFEVRELCFFLHSQGFNHGYNVGQSIEKHLTLGKARRADRNLGLTRNRWNGGKAGLADTGGTIKLTTKEAKRWEKWNSTLKPTLEPCVIMRKPLSEKNVALNVMKWGTGALNTWDTRIESSDNKRTKDGSRHPTPLLRMTSLEPSEINRYYYCLKTSTRERGGSNHPTQKPIALMRYFATLITPPGGLLLDPFMGSNSTGIAASVLDCDYIGVEQDPEEFKGAVKKTRYHLEGKKN